MKNTFKYVITQLHNNSYIIQLPAPGCSSFSVKQYFGPWAAHTPRLGPKGHSSHALSPQSPNNDGQLPTEALIANLTRENAISWSG